MGVVVFLHIACLFYMYMYLANFYSNISFGYRCCISLVWYLYPAISAVLLHKLVDGKDIYLWNCQ